MSGSFPPGSFLSGPFLPDLYIQTTNAPRDIQRLAALELEPGEKQTQFDKIIYPMSRVGITSPDPAATRARLISEGWREDEVFLRLP